MDRGALVPDEVTIKMLESEVNKHPESNGFIFDGFPRTGAQALALDAFLESHDTGIVAMLALEVPEEELRARLKNRALTSGRADDANPDVIQNRINVYNNETAPVAEYYRSQGKYQGVVGVGTIQEISERLFDAIDQHA